MNFPDAGYRMLTLYRYWNIIQYYFPYKHLIEEDWKSVLEEFIPKFVNSKNQTEYTLTVLELISRVHDTHANIWGNSDILKNFRGVNYAPVELTFIENKPIVTGYYDDQLGKETGLEVGDIILSLNNKRVEDIVKANLKLTPASNYPTQLRNIARNLLRTNDSIINIQFKRNGIKNSKTIKSYSSDKINIYKKFQKQDTCFKLLEQNVGYLYLGTIKEKYLPSIFRDIEKTDGLIIDLRCYPSEFVVFSLGNYLMPRAKEFVKFSVGNIINPGFFTITPPLKVGKISNDYYKGKIVILINENTQSQAEYTTMAFRVAPNVSVIGSTTAGSDGNVSQFYLPGGISTMISGIGVYYPNGKETQRIGIVPDLEIKPTIAGIKDGRDEVLEKL